VTVQIPSAIEPAAVRIPASALTATHRSGPLARRIAYGDDNGTKAARVEEQCPPDARVGSRSEPVHHGDRPTRVGEPVDGPPGTEAELRAEQAGDHQGPRSTLMPRPQSKPQRSVRRGERDEGIAEAEMSKGIQNGGGHVEDDEHNRGQRQKPVHGLGEKYRPIRRCPARAEKNAKDHDRGQEQQ